ncbi:hypothetical protein [Nodularia spumigena]|nr:hypothetical protein [Nodularia spumigena]MDB9318251.1 hypothetical protein [Nodularia spumigena CS-590/01A]
MELALFDDSRCAKIINPHEMERTKVLTTGTIAAPSDWSSQHF